MNCSTHGIAAGPDGRCAICHGTERVRDGRRAKRAGLLVIVGLLLSSGVLVGALALRRMLTEAGGASLAATGAEPSEGRADSREVEDTPSPESELAEEAVEEEPSAERETPASAEREPEETRSAAELLRDTPIVMFSAPSCRSCDRARAHLKANGISWDERNVESPSVKAEVLEHCKKARLSSFVSDRIFSEGLPAFLVDGSFLFGFGEGPMNHAIVQSVQRRSGKRIRVTMYAAPLGSYGPE